MSKSVSYPAALIALSLVAHPAVGAPITALDFGASPNAITFEGITNACSNTIPGRFPCGVAPWTIGDATFSHVSNGSGCWDLPNFAIGLGQSLRFNATDADYTIDFASPFTTIGLTVVLGGNYDVGFYRGGSLLGKVSVTNGSLYSRGFAGWRDDRGIDRIRVVETSRNNNSAALDNILWEGTPIETTPVPLPAAGWMLLAGAGLLGAVGAGRRKA